MPAPSKEELIGAYEMPLDDDEETLGGFDDDNLFKGEFEQPDEEPEPPAPATPETPAAPAAATPAAPEPPAEPPAEPAAPPAEPAAPAAPEFSERETMLMRQNQELQGRVVQMQQTLEQHEEAINPPPQLVKREDLQWPTEDDYETDGKAAADLVIANEKKIADSEKEYQAFMQTKEGQRLGRIQQGQRKSMAGIQQHYAEDLQNPQIRTEFEATLGITGTNSIQYQRVGRHLEECEAAPWLAMLYAKERVRVAEMAMQQTPQQPAAATPAQPAAPAAPNPNDPSLPPQPHQVGNPRHMATPGSNAAAVAPAATPAAPQHVQLSAEQMNFCKENDIDPKAFAESLSVDRGML